MFYSQALVAILMVAVTVVQAKDSSKGSTVVQDHYEEWRSYSRNPQCRPSKLDTGLKCKDIGAAVEIQGGLYSNWELHYVPLASAYYVARMADAMGYQDSCPTNTTFLQTLDMQTPWSGTHGAIAVDGVLGYERLIRRVCQFPTAPWPFLCSGAEGTPETFGKRLETLSYNSILQGANNRWCLFVHCWRAKTPENPNARDIATSFNVFNLDPVFTAGDRQLVLDELNRRGFNTHPSNLIEFDYSS